MMNDGKANGPIRDGDPDLDPREDEALWRLLGRAQPPPAASPYFARRVLREAGTLEESRALRPGWLARVWRAWRQQPRTAFAGAVAAVALLAAGGVGLTSPWHSRPVVIVSPSVAVDEPATAAPDDAAAAPDLAAAPEAITAQDVEVIADLDNLISREESRLWTEDETTARF